MKNNAIQINIYKYNTNGEDQILQPFIYIQNQLSELVRTAVIL